MSRPVVCTLDGPDMVDRGKAWQKLLGSGLVRRERVPGGIRLTAEPGAAKALLDLVGLERECCAWIDYVVEGGSVTMTAGPAGEAALARMFVVGS